MRVNMIVAADLTDGIGIENRLAWRLPNDLKYFKQMTEHGIVVMGRKTFESLPSPLPNRRNVVLTSSVIPSTECYSSVEEFMSVMEKDGVEEIWVIGGAQVYLAFKDLITDIYLTRVYTVELTDTSLPEEISKLMTLFKIKSVVCHYEEEGHPFYHTFNHYRKL